MPPPPSLVMSAESRLGARAERLIRHPACALGCAAAIAALAFVLVSARALPLLGGILATLAIGVIGPWIAIAGATVAIAWDRQRCRAGDTLTATITWRSILPWWRPRVALRWPDAETMRGSRGDSTVVSSDAADGAGDHVAVVPLRRGRFPRVAPVIESTQPFGVVTARRAVAVPEQVIVWPARDHVQMPAGLVAAAGSGREISERITGHSGDSIGARDYRTGDSVRSIHWAHTARRDTLVVRERPGTAAAVVRLVVDHRSHHRHSHGDREGGAATAAENARQLDALVGRAFAIIESWHPRGVRFELVWPGRAAFTPRTPAEVSAMLDELACLELSADPEPAPPRRRPRPVDLEILLTTPPGRASLAAAVGVAAQARYERLWIIVDGEEVALVPQSGRRRSHAPT